MVIAYSVNYLAVLVATIASFVSGFLWYGPLFGKKWQKMMKFTEKSMKSMNLTPMKAMTLGFITTLITVYVLAMFIKVAGATTISGGLLVGFWIWLGFIATTTLGSYLWEGKSLNLYFFNNAFNIINILIVSAILSVWQ